MSERSMNSTTSILTALAGLYTMAMAVVAPLATIFVIWTHVGLLLGCAASVVGICKGLHEWYMKIQARREEREEHRARMHLYEGEEDE